MVAVACRCDSNYFCTDTTCITCILLQPCLTDSKCVFVRGKTLPVYWKQLLKMFFNTCCLVYNGACTFVGGEVACVLETAADDVL